MPDHPLQLLLLQIVLILITARVCGRLLRLLGQPQVVGEMFAGILLGPSLLGQFQGGYLLEAIFPKTSRSNIEIFSQMGVILFMFLVGLEVDLTRLMRKSKAVFLTASMTMAVPFLCGLALAPVLLRLGYGPGAEGSEQGFILFMATAMSITAFPVLARILTEMNMHRTPTGTFAIACAALNDVGGWCMLAVVLAVAKAGGAALRVVEIAGMTMGLTVLFAAGMIFLIRPVLGRLQAMFNSRGYLTGDILGVVFILLILSAWVTDRIGIHALFGAFLLGAVMPCEPRFVEHLTHKMEDIATLFLLPLFFVYTGLNTNSGLIEGVPGWAVAGLITLVATVGKVGGTLAAVKWTGLSGRHTLTLGLLMNTRGLMELVILNVALSVQAIDSRVFSMMVIMTLVTTVMTTPLVRLLYRREDISENEMSGRGGAVAASPLKAPEGR